MAFFANSFSIFEEEDKKKRTTNTTNLLLLKEETQRGEGEEYER
tara:strand:+ start:2697 stop:2828 length:132 start_codon:yes stop_codon:yes gene_type:complete